LGAVVRLKHEPLPSEFQLRFFERYSKPQSFHEEFERAFRILAAVGFVFFWGVVPRGMLLDFAGASFRCAKNRTGFVI